MSTQNFYAPFDHLNELVFYEEDTRCEGARKEDMLQSMSMEELIRERDSLMESIADYETIIEIELDSQNPDLESLRNDRKRKQQLIVELREVKKMMKRKRKEVFAA